MPVSSTDLVSAANAIVPRVTGDQAQQMIAAGAVLLDIRDSAELAATGKAVQPFIVGPGEQAYPSWSPDGRYVAFASDAGNAAGKADIHVAGNDGAIVARITAEPGYNSYPSWSKSGGELYFNSERNGVRNVFRVLLDDTGACLKPANGSQGS